MSEHECPVCEAAAPGAMDCREAQLCNACNHTHDHSGCTKCECDLCPKCGHVHSDAHHEDNNEE